MATVEELHFDLLGRDVGWIDGELAQLELAVNRPGGGRDSAIVASRIEAAARALRRKLEQQSAALWLLFQDPARRSHANRIHGRIERMFDRILGILGPGDQRLRNGSLAEKLQRIQELNKEIAGHRTLQQARLPDAAYWRHAPGQGLEADPWSSLVLLSAVLSDFVHVMLRRPKG